MIDFNVRGKNTSPTDSSLIALADDEVLNAAADIAGTGFADAQRELILYMRGIKTPEGRRRIISMAGCVISKMIRAGAGENFGFAALPTAVDWLGSQMCTKRHWGAERLQPSELPIVPRRVQGRRAAPAP
jgi:hypothetical protein